MGLMFSQSLKKCALNRKAEWINFITSSSYPPLNVAFSIIPMGTLGCSSDNVGPRVEAQYVRVICIHSLPAHTYRLNSIQSHTRIDPQFLWGSGVRVPTCSSAHSITGLASQGASQGWLSA